MSAPVNQDCSVHVSNLHPSVTDAVLHNIFKDKNIICKKIRIFRDEKQKSKESATITFPTQDQQNKAIDALNLTFILDTKLVHNQKRIVLTKQKDHTDLQKIKQNNTVHVKGFSNNVSDPREIYRFFTQYGQIFKFKNIEVMFSKNKLPRQGPYCTITFEEQSHKETLLQAFNDTQGEGIEFSYQSVSTYPYVNTNGEIEDKQQFKNDKCRLFVQTFDNNIQTEQKIEIKGFNEEFLQQHKPDFDLDVEYRSSRGEETKEEKEQNEQQQQSINNQTDFPDVQKTIESIQKKVQENDTVLEKIKAETKIQLVKFLQQNPAEKDGVVNEENYKKYNELNDTLHKDYYKKGTEIEYSFYKKQLSTIEGRQFESPKELALELLKIKQEDIRDQYRTRSVDKLKNYQKQLTEKVQSIYSNYGTTKNVSVNFKDNKSVEFSLNDNVTPYSYIAYEGDLKTAVYDQKDRVINKKADPYQYILLKNLLTDATSEQSAVFRQNLLKDIQKNSKYGVDLIKFSKPDFKQGEIDISQATVFFDNYDDAYNFFTKVHETDSIYQRSVKKYFYEENIHNQITIHLSKKLRQTPAKKKQGVLPNIMHYPTQPITQFIQDFHTNPQRNQPKIQNFQQRDRDQRSVQQQQNHTKPQPQPIIVDQQVQPAKKPDQPDISLDQIMKLENAKRTQYLGNKMYPKVEEYIKSMGLEHSLVPKITGMMIDPDVFEISEILEMLDNPQEMQTRVSEAHQILKQENE